MRALEEWIAKHDDAPIPERVQLRVFQRFDGRCPKCSRKLQPKHWDCDHIVALVNGGQHRESNLQPLCTSPCHTQKTREDVHTKSVTYRKSKRNAGTKRMRKTIPGRRFNGEPIPSRVVWR